ncbi:nicotinate (nicotinamide) nucleotide adenylyltransferase [Candidatus Palauibacter sp.]|uniref:nicotinate (nicotinamide) nucleotide adenylyltransferase n=1 Tax=Candidatus Palauibacter sp. TaxID=3101350 RepID=UPI003AF315CE
MPPPSADRPFSGRRIGVFGGSFDPPHVGHAIVARELVEQLRLERLLVIPAADPPHRSAVLPAATRFELTRRLFRGIPRIEVSPLEFRRSGPSFTVDTLEELARQFQDDRLILAMGADRFAALDGWKDPDRVRELARIAVMPRGGREPVSPPAATPIDYLVVNVTRIDVSASRIRRRLREGRSVRHLVPESIRHDVERALADRSGRPRNPASPGC